MKCACCRVFVLAWMIYPLATQVSASAPDPVAKTSPFVVNLADYAKGDGSDETEAIQKAINAIPPKEYKEDISNNHPGAVLVIPRPPVAYCISKTISIVERWNTVIRCETRVLGTRNGPINQYFRWIGPDNGTMFEIRQCNGLVVENLSMTGMDEPCLRRAKSVPGYTVPGRLTRGVTGLRIGPEGRAAGFATMITVDNLQISQVAVGIRLGDFANNGPDIRDMTFRNTNIGPFSQHGIIAASGNLANTTFETLHTWAETGATSAIRMCGGELLLLNWAGNSDPHPNPDGAEVEIFAGGIQVVKGWSEWFGPFLRASTRFPEWTKGSDGTVNYPIILQGVRHFAGFWDAEKKQNLVPVSIKYDACVPLHLIGCSLWGKVELGEGSQSIILSQGTVFIDKDCEGFTGPGVTRYGRLLQLGTTHPKNARILEPYIVDRRCTPGAAPPAKGVWQRGDGIVNTEPDPNVAAKAWRGWICIKGGEPGEWAPYGAIGSPSAAQAHPSQR